MTQTQLPNTIILHQLYNDAETGLAKGVIMVNEAYSILLKIEELQPIPTDLKQINLAWIKSFFDKRKALVSSDLSLTNNERLERLKKWNGLQLHSTNQIKAITSIIEQYPSAVWQFNEHLQRWNCLNIIEVAEAVSTVEVPEKAKLHWGKIQAALNALKELRQWETANDVQSIPLANLQYMGFPRLAEDWINSTIFINPKYSQYRTTQKLTI